MPIKEHGKEYFQVPTLNVVAVSRDGDAIWVSTKEIIKQGMSGDYKCINVFGTSRHTHRLMAITFLSEGNPIDDLDVNHIDTDKLNNNLTNLELVTRSYNCIHALENGLWKSAKPVLVKDLRTEEVVEYYGVNECARAFGVNPALISQYLQDTSRVRRMFYVFILKGQEWPETNLESALLQAKGAKKVSVAVNVDTKETLIFSELAKAAELIGVSGDTLRVHISRYGEKPYHGYSFRYANTVDELIEGLNKRETKTARPIAKRKPLRVSVKNTETGEVGEFESLRVFSDFIGKKFNTVQKAVCRHRRYGRYLISYITQCPPK